VGRREAGAWSAGVIALVLWLGVMLSWDISRPWTGHHDWNGVVWSQSAHNNLRAGLSTTWGIPTGRYSGALPIPPAGYYVHHPPGLPLAVTATFLLFGEREWAARLVPIACSLVSAVLLWFLVATGAGRRAATLSVAVFSLLPMELYFGRMVNHEAPALTWMLGALLSLEYWRRTGRRAWLVVLFACFVLGMWTAWAVYFLALVLAVMILLTRGSGARRLALALLAFGALSCVLYVLCVRAVRPDAWSDAWQAIAFRLQGQGASGVPFSWGEWWGRQREYLGALIPVVAWGLAVVGAVYVALRSRGSPGFRSLGWSALALALTAAIPVLGFRNASYIHDYTGFYFVAPVAVLGGLTLDGLLRRAWTAEALPLLRGACVGGAVAALALLGLRGYEKTRALHRIQWWVLDGKVAEPPDLIPALGEAIYRTFPDETMVVTNLSARGPHLGYYARRELLYGHTTYAEWKPVLSQAGEHVGCVVWLGAPGAEELWAQLPEGRRKVLELGGLRFGFWRPGLSQPGSGQPAPDQPGAGQAGATQAGPNLSGQTFRSVRRGGEGASALSLQLPVGREGRRWFSGGG